ncbi:L-rhamnose mutarotase [Sphingomonas sp. BIUV-7]|uniref:L-rhamnose mutarotase n=1 Tax=Sphingomonas natans TaxID=3063330 RepID=A0ABT8Y3H7_9SPHN|nr:L-rhamnose mutarotase [Sphingomonas sp. BIUV-7]MDO6412869.1 L-rhamnose mutarotase [Sphingomonas sp. BIUV-7]
MSIQAFKMQLKPGVIAEYRKRHDEIWPELSALLTDSGISDYSIFLDENTLSLFAVLKVAEVNSQADMPHHPVMKRWWDYMAPLMEVEPDNRPKEWPLPMIFHHA